MKKIVLILTLVFISLMINHTNAKADDGSDIVTFADNDVETIVKNQLSIPTDEPVTKADMKQLTEFKSKDSSVEVTSFEGLEYATNLTYFSVSYSEVTDFSILRNFTDLEVLVIEHQNFDATTLPDLDYFSKLTGVDFSRSNSNNTIVDKIALSDTVSEINISYNRNITDVSKFADMDSLITCNVQFCGIANFEWVNNASDSFMSLLGYNQSDSASSEIKRSDFDYNEETETLSLPYANMPNRLTNFDGYTPPFMENNDPIEIQYKVTDGEEEYIDYISALDIEGCTISYQDSAIVIQGLPKELFSKIVTLSFYSEYDNEAGTYNTPSNMEDYITSNGSYSLNYEVSDNIYQVTAEYKDDAGNEIAPEEVLTGELYTAFNTNEKTIPGYQLTEKPANATGEFQLTPQTVSYIYKKMDGAAVTVKYEDEAGNTLSDSIILTGKLGNKYQTEAKSIPGYQLKEKPSNTEGTYTNNPQEVIYIYEKITTDDNSKNANQQNSDIKPADKSNSNTAVKITAQKTLPKTGDTNPSIVLGMGLLLTIFAGRILYKKIN